MRARGEGCGGVAVDDRRRLQRLLAGQAPPPPAAQPHKGGQREGCGAACSCANDGPNRHRTVGRGGACVHRVRAAGRAAAQRGMLQWARTGACWRQASAAARHLPSEGSRAVGSVHSTPALILHGWLAASASSSRVQPVEKQRAGTAGPRLLAAARFHVHARPVKADPNTLWQAAAASASCQPTPQTWQREGVERAQHTA